MENYVEGHRKSGIKVGDKVRVTRKAEDYEDGWDNTWECEMDSLLNEKEFNIVEALEEKGFGIIVPYNRYWWLPYFVLEKI